MALGEDAIRHTFIVGLRDAHALEHQALALMDRQIEHLAEYADVESLAGRNIVAMNVGVRPNARRLEELSWMVDAGKLSDSLGIPVVPVTATFLPR